MSQPAELSVPDSKRGFSVVVFLGLAIVVPMLLTWSGTGRQGGDVPWSSACVRFLVVAYCSWHLAALFARGEPRWFATIFWAFGYVWMGLAGLLQLLANRNPFGFSVLPEDDLASSLVVLLGMAAAHLAYSRSRGVEPSDRSRVPRYVSPRAVTVLVAVTVVLTPLLLLQQAGLGTYLQSRASVNESLAEAGLLTGDSLALGGIVRSLTLVPPLAALLGITAALRYYPPLRFRPAWWLMTLVVLGLNVLVNNPVGNSRFWFGTVLLGVLFSLPLLQKRNAYRVFLVGLLVALTVVFPYADYFRLDETGGRDRQPVSFFMVTKLDYDAAAQVTYAMGLHDVRGPDLGYQILGALGFFVPRAIWEGKPRPTGELLAEHSGFHFTNLSAPLWAEAYLALGVVGVVLVFGLLGWLMGRGDRAMLSAFRSSDFLLASILLPPLAAYMMILLRGSLLAAVGQGAILAVVLYLLGQRRRPSVRAVPGTRAHERARQWELESRPGLAPAP